MSLKPSTSESEFIFVLGYLGNLQNLGKLGLSPPNRGLEYKASKPKSAALNSASNEILVKYRGYLKVKCFLLLGI